MDGYTIGDISNFLNASSAPKKPPANDLFSSKPQTTVAVEEVYAKPDISPAKGKRPKKSKTITPPEPEESKFPRLSPEEQLAVDKCTLFIGNLPIGLKRKQLRKLFADFGKIESLRFRSVAISDLKLGRKVCLKSNKVNENASNKNAYIVFEDEECVEKALSKNGSHVNDHYIRVDRVVKSKQEIKDDSQKSVFIGNIPFAATEEDIRTALDQCGDIEYVRLLRDSKTNIGKGFGYVKFVDSSGVMLAMKIKDTVEVGGRKLRIQRCKSKITLENVKKAKELKAKRSEEKQSTFRGRKSKDSDKNLFVNTKTKSRHKKVDPEKRPKANKQNTMSKKRFDKKVNKVSKKGEVVANIGKKKKQ